MARSNRNKRSRNSQEFDPSRWAHAAFMLGAFLSMWVFSHLIEDVWAMLWSVWPQHVGRPSSLMSQGIGVSIGLVIAVWAWRVERYFKFVCEVAIEVSQITWPTRSETRAATVVVVVITLICSGILSVMDLSWSSVTDYLYGL